MSNNVKEEYRSIRGMPDILSSEVVLWNKLEATILKLMARYGYDQIRLPLLEKTALFKRAIGEVTDIVEKEMFSFLDEKKRSLSLRPEGTASCVRACIEHSLLRNLPQKLWYQGPMFRYEAPQKGRNRQFHQVGVECFGVASWEAEIEQISMFSRLWADLGLKDVIQLEINNLGTYNERNLYIKDLVAYLQKHYQQLDHDCQRRLQINPLRILDSKNPEIQSLLEKAPKLFDYLDQRSLDDYNILKDQLNLLGISYQENHKIVRGLDYYTGTVWEWTSKLLGAQSAVGAGGRYDNLVSQLGGLSVPAVGLAIGIERVILLLQQKNTNISEVAPDGYLICVGASATQRKFAMAERIRNMSSKFSLKVDLSGGSFKNQFKRADKSGAKVALVVGDDEINNYSVTIKYLRSDINNVPKQAVNQQLTVHLLDLHKYIEDLNTRVTYL